MQLLRVAVGNLQSGINNQSETATSIPVEQQPVNQVHQPVPVTATTTENTNVVPASIPQHAAIQEHRRTFNCQSVCQTFHVFNIFILQ